MSGDTLAGVVCGDAEAGDMVVYCECGLLRAATKPHGYQKHAPLPGSVELRHVEHRRRDDSDDRALGPAEPYRWFGQAES
jgi:hypothetical protein